MPDCYLCGAYIERGAGYRRNVQTETSTRVYVTRHGGGSLGTRHALRTVCRTCAHMHDRLEKGGWLRSILYVLGYGLSLWAGWRLVFFGPREVDWTDWFGIACLLGIPVLIIGFVLESIRRAIILNSGPKSAFDPKLARKHGETVNAWLERVLPILADTEESWNYVISCARAYPPTVGQLLGDWIQSIPEGGPPPARRRYPEESEDPEPHLFRAEDTLETWTDRVAADMVVRAGADYDDFHDNLLNLATFAHPRVGESVRLFSGRAYAIAERVFGDDA